MSSHPPPRARRARRTLGRIGGVRLKGNPTTDADTHDPACFAIVADGDQVGNPAVHLLCHDVPVPRVTMPVRAASRARAARGAGTRRGTAAAAAAPDFAGRGGGSACPHDRRRRLGQMRVLEGTVGRASKASSGTRLGEAASGSEATHPLANPLAAKRLACRKVPRYDTSV